MIKKLTKITGMLVAITSLVYAMPVNAAVHKIQAKNGIVEDALSYDGSYIYKGYNTDTDESSVYLNHGDNDTVIKDSKDYSFNFDVKYGDKSIIAHNGIDYILDLSSGNIGKDDYSDIENSLKSTLEEKFSSLYRYSSDSKPVLYKFDQSSFHKPLYKYSTTKYTGFTDSEGSYVDASYTANISVVDNRGKLINIKNYEDDYSGIKAKFMDTQAIAQDNSYIYARTNILIAGEKAPSDNILTFIQKISKKQQKTDDGLCIPETVESYEITDKYNSDSAKSAYDLLNSTGKIFVKDGNLYVVQKLISIDNTIKVSRLKLTSEPAQLNSIPATMYDVNFVTSDSETVHKVSPSASYSIDVNNNVWSIDNGYIFKIDELNVQDMYECDNRLNELNVYDDDNLIAWNTPEGIYSSVVNGK